MLNSAWAPNIGAHLRHTAVERALLCALPSQPRKGCAWQWVRTLEPRIQPTSTPRAPPMAEEAARESRRKP